MPLYCDRCGAQLPVGEALWLDSLRALCLRCRGKDPLQLEKLALQLAGHIEAMADDAYLTGHPRMAGDRHRGQGSEREVSMKAYKRYSTTKGKAGDSPFIRVGDFYIVGIDPMTDIAVIDPEGHITGHINAMHLDALGNGNYAKPTKTNPRSGTAWKGEIIQ